MAARTDQGARMKAIVHERYGPPDGLRLTEVPAPVVEADRVLVRVRAAAANPLDVHLMRGRPYFVRLFEGLLRPKRVVPGADVAGVVEAVGPAVTAFKPGDEVFGGCAGSFAELVRPREPFLVLKPPGVTFEQAATLPVAGCTALQALRNHGKLQAGQHVLVNGASGGVGTFAVQIAKAMGARVTGVCSARNAELVRSIGADDVIDYAAEDFTRSGTRYDLVVDAVGNHSARALCRATARTGRVVFIGGGGGRVLGPLGGVVRARAYASFARRRITVFIASTPPDDLRALAEMVVSGAVTPVIGATYRLEDAAEALRVVASKRARGKLVVSV